MSFPEIYTALSIPTVSSSPSLNCIQWNGIGQVCFTTKAAVYILTPELGINFDVSSVTRAPVHNESNAKQNAVLGWFKTMIELSKAPNPRAWTEISQDWGALALGSLDVVLRAIACSPCILTSTDARCFITTLSSNMDLILWCAAKNHLKGEWVVVADVTQLLIAHFNDNVEGLSPTARILHAQTTCIAWSQQANFDINPAPLCDASLLVVANRAGCLNFLRVDGEKPETVHILHTVKVSDKWITHIAFSSWSLVGPGKCEAYVAYGLSDGAIGVVEVTHTLQSYISAFEPDHTIETVFVPRNTMLYDADKRGITGLTWVTCPDNKLILVHCKPGVVHLWSPPTTLGLDPQLESRTGWTGNRTVFLQTQRLSVGSSCLHPISGLYHIRRHDALVVCLFDGSFHVIKNLSREPVWSSTTPAVPTLLVARSNALTTESLCAASRAAFALAERREVQHADVNRISGMLAYDDYSSTVMWLHEASRPADFSYKHDAQHNSVFVMARMWEDGLDTASVDEDEQMLVELRKVLGNVTVGSGQYPIHLLRSIFLYLRDDGILHRLHSRILEILSLHSTLMMDPILVASESHTFAAFNAISALPPWRGGVTLEMRRSFRRSLRRDLFGWTDLLSLRMRLSLADYCRKLSQDATRREEYSRVIEQLLSAVSYRVLRTIIRHLMAVAEILSPNDAPFVTKIISRSMFPGTPPDLTHEAQRLAATLHSDLNPSSETCPACGVEIPNSDLNNAVCVNGHAWARCSVTYFIMSTPMVRTCVGCSRKALSPLSSSVDAHGSDKDKDNWLPTEAAQSWIVEDLLAAVCCCLFCGNSFVSVL